MGVSNSVHLQKVLSIGEYHVPSSLGASGASSAAPPAAAPPAAAAAPPPPPPDGTEASLEDPSEIN